MVSFRRIAAAISVPVLLIGCVSSQGEGRDGDSAALRSPENVAGGACPEPDPPAVAGAGPAVLPDLGDSLPPHAYTVEVLDRLPHDETAFTQGLLHASGLLYESTGRYGESDVRLVEPGTGDVLTQVPLRDNLFGEGLAMHDGRLFQLTWREQQVHVWDRCTLDDLGEMSYDGEGWGLTGDGEVLWRSDGSDTLYQHDPETFDVVGTVGVSDRGVALTRINELELVDGNIMANVFRESWIAVIDIGSGRVTGWVDASPLAGEVQADNHNDVLNGIAVDPATGRLWLTGKRWPVLFEVRIVEGDTLPAPGLR